jgi:hypothetical protein
MVQGEAEADVGGATHAHDEAFAATARHGRDAAEVA